MERSPSTISREVRRNRSKRPQYRKLYNPYGYNHWRAKNLYIHRLREQNRAALEPNTGAWDYIDDGLKRFWTPEEICGRWHKFFPDAKPLCVFTIYRYIELGEKFPEITTKSISDAVGSEYRPEMPIITPSIRTVSSPNGQRRSVTGFELATGKAIRCMAVLGKGFWSARWTERAGFSRLGCSEAALRREPSR